MQSLQRQAKFAPGGVLPQFGLLGDWVALDPLCPGSGDACLKSPGFIRGNPTTSFYYLVCLEAMSAIAKDLGKNADAAMYAREYAAGLKAYHAVFYNASAGDYGHQQTANVMPLYLGTVPHDLEDGVIKSLIRGINTYPTPDNGGHLYRRVDNLYLGIILLHVDIV